MLVCAVLSAGMASGAESLQGPVDVKIRRMMLGKPGGLYPCPHGPAPIAEVVAVDYFTDEARSLVDKDQLERHRAIVKPLEDTSRVLQAMAESYVRAAPVVNDIAVCAADWLDDWAEAGALLSPPANPSAEMLRANFLVALAMPWSVLREDVMISRGRRDAIDRWMLEIARAVKEDYETAIAHQPVEKGSGWAVTAVMLVAGLANDRPLFDWSVSAFRRELGRIGPDGTMSVELGRAGRARYAHLASLTALTLGARIAAANGMDLVGPAGSPLRRLKDLVTGALRGDGNRFETLTGVKQVWPTRKGPWLYCWAEIWQSRWPEEGIAALLKPENRPARWLWCGGDATTFFGPSTAAAPIP